MGVLAKALEIPIAVHHFSRGAFWACPKTLVRQKSKAPSKLLAQLFLRMSWPNRAVEWDARQLRWLRAPHRRR